MRDPSGAVHGGAGGSDAVTQTAIARRRLVCRGAVQGVGFRPAVHRLATSLGLAGRVLNSPQGAEIEIEGPSGIVERFVHRLRSSLPPLARVEDLQILEIEPLGETTFVVEASALGPRRGALIPPDAAICPDCRSEMQDSSDRRFRYPFTNCTNCGPRFSLARALPYDRERTSMACFPMCRACRREYTDPSDRRFHAEPICCPDCGPRLWLAAAGGARLAEASAALGAAREALRRGSILAVKGLGGFQLACPAGDEESVRRLRERKGRPTKPFAVMVRDLETARRLVHLQPEDEMVLASPRAPILLAPRRAVVGVADAVAPGLDDLGVMLPTTPLHVDLFRDAAYEALVMTSGNEGDEPICRRNREALSRLGAIADLFLLHDRDVVRRADDSVLRSRPGARMLVRRARGWVPEPLPLPEPAPEAVLALGAHLQDVACLAAGREAFLSQHVGDLDNEPARAFLREVVQGLEEFLQTEAGVVAVDMHPDYASTWIGEEIASARGARLIRIQHHLAHAAAVLAEHGAFPRTGESAAAVVLDGTGWGPDGVAWGGEWLVLHGALTWRRAAHLEPIPLVGGEKAVREPWRVLAAALAMEGEPDAICRLPVAAQVPPGSLEALLELAPFAAAPRATGAGRLFEAAGALLGLCARNSWEGEAAARLESLAGGARQADPWEEVRPRRGIGGPVLPGPALLAAAARRFIGGEAPADVAAGFHATFTSLAAEITLEVIPREVGAVALGGGCLVNRLLIRGLSERLASAGLRALVPGSVPPGDGGIAYGQAAIAAAAAARGKDPVLEGGL